jgi:pimeloyl-ACP methyl ester carboxylesterase
MRTLFFFLLVFSTPNLYAQTSPVGNWDAKLDVGSMVLQLVFHIQQEADGTLKATMDSPDQGAKGIPVTNAVLKGDSLLLALPQAGIQYAGKVEADLITGTFKQGGAAFPLDLKRSVGAPKQVLRPQVPQSPFPYASEEVTFKNESAGITLAGTLTVPKSGKNFPAVVLISGSGPQNRDEEILGHKPFLVLADYLTRQGIAVLRYDDRGTAASGGVFIGATSADFAQDATAALQYLRSRKEINSKKVGIAGHSEGGLIAPMIAAQLPKEVAFLVLLAPPAVRGDSLLLLQQGLIAKASGMPEATVTDFVNANRGAFEIVLQNEDSVLLRRKMETYLAALTDTADLPAGTTKEAAIAAQIKSITEPWMQHFMRTDPVPFLQKVKCPVLALWGSNDLQVPPAQNEPALKAALSAGGNKDVTATTLPGLNHLFQTSSTGLPAEYAKIEETFSLTVMLQIADWIKAETK